MSEYYKEYRKRNSKKLAAKSKKWREENPERYNAQMKNYRATEKNKQWRKRYMASYNKKHYLKNLKHNLERAKVYRRLNPDKVKIAQRNWTRGKIANDLNFRLLSLFRRRIHSAIKQNFGTKAYKTTELIGCSIQEARTHLEKKFRKGMSWKNYGKVWHIDHIMPCKVFDLTKPKQQKKCFHYTNLQPLFAEENLAKGAKI